MSTTSHIATAAAQQKFTELRKRLDQLGYRQPLGIESLPLVEKLFFDLIHTTESLKVCCTHCLFFGGISLWSELTFTVSIYPYPQLKPVFDVIFVKKQSQNVKVLPLLPKVRSLNLSLYSTLYMYIFAKYFISESQAAARQKWQRTEWERCYNWAIQRGECQTGQRK